MEESTESTEVVKKRKFLEVLKKKAGNVSAATTAFGIHRTTYYLWMEEEWFKKEVTDIREGLIDYAESKLMQRISHNDTTALIFFLKTQAKKRGYVERTEHTGAEGGAINVYHSIPPVEEEEEENS